MGTDCENDTHKYSYERVILQRYKVNATRFE